MDIITIYKRTCEEIKADAHPVIIIAATDIANILIFHGYESLVDKFPGGAVQLLRRLLLETYIDPQAVN